MTGAAAFWAALAMALAAWGLRAVHRRPVQGDTDARQLPPEKAPAQVTLPGGTVFDVARHLGFSHGIPLLDWDAAAAAARSHGSAHEAEALAILRRAWLLHLGEALGSTFRLRESPEAIVLSALDEVTATALLRYVATTRRRLLRVLEGVAQFAPGEKSVVLVLDDEDSYYRYIANHYPDDGEFGFSGGVFLAEGCPHFVVKRNDLRAIEPVIAHEMTHSALAHLDLPLWLDEGLAVNTERTLAGSTGNGHTPQQLHGKHVAFWDPARIQEFWSGRSFYRTDDGQMLSYELARILVQEMARDWPSFGAFTREARRDDAGHDAARRLLGVDLAASVCALFGKAPDEGWRPDPGRWEPA